MKIHHFMSLFTMFCCLWVSNRPCFISIWLLVYFYQFVGITAFVRMIYSQLMFWSQQKVYKREEVTCKVDEEKMFKHIRTTMRNTRKEGHCDNIQAKIPRGRRLRCSQSISYYNELARYKTLRLKKVPCSEETDSLLLELWWQIIYFPL